jgi:magnesium transporter
MRTLTASSIILMTCSLIAGIYGMNFRHMPELDWRFGYPAALSLMLGSGGVLVYVFQRRHWW